MFVYDLVHKNWYMYGNCASKGYVCLLSPGGHFDVLKGQCGRPLVPQQAVKLS